MLHLTLRHLKSHYELLNLGKEEPETHSNIQNLFLPVNRVEWFVFFAFWQAQQEALDFFLFSFGTHTHKRTHWICIWKRIIFVCDFPPMDRKFVCGLTDRDSSLLCILLRRLNLGWAHTINHVRHISVGVYPNKPFWPTSNRSANCLQQPEVYFTVTDDKRLSYKCKIRPQSCSNSYFGCSFGRQWQ